MHISIKIKATYSSHFDREELRQQIINNIQKQSYGNTTKYKTYISRYTRGNKRSHSVFEA